MIFGYIDPGAGSLLIQGLIAGALAIPFLIRSHIARAVDRLRGRQGRRTPDEADA